MRMRQSMAQLEREFEEEAVLDRRRREQLRRQAIKRTRKRRREKIERGQQFRFLLLMASFRSVYIPALSICLNLLSVGAAYGLMVLMASIALTVVVVTVAMFETLAWLMG